MACIGKNLRIADNVFTKLSLLLNHPKNQLIIGILQIPQPYIHDGHNKWPSSINERPVIHQGVEYAF
ncbi:hypothetical protein AMK34_10365 [Amycolatopsis sp. CB00013]|nr:hypothetical protein AMK34_10365 [Amycolatopsis sp. CB00013]